MNSGTCRHPIAYEGIFEKGSPGAGLPAAVVLLLGLVACGGSDGGPTEPEPEPSVGSLRVTTSTVAGGLDADGFRMVLDGGEELFIGPDDTVVVDEVEAGDHTVDLIGLEAGCVVEGDNPREVSATADDTATVAFAARCGLRDRIVFYSYQDGNDELYVMGADGSNPTRLTETEADEREPAVSPDGSYIAYWTTVSRLIYVMEADGSNPTAIAGSEYPSWAPAWSPDGSQIAFATFRDSVFGLYVMDADGSNPRAVLIDEDQIDGPDWSPDGSQIAFRADGDGDGEVYVIGVADANLRRLTESDSTDTSPVWSPDGSRIAFTSDRDGSDAIYVVCSNGANTPQPITGNSARDGGAAWSPDGSRIAFHSDRDGPYGIHVMGSDGSDPTSLVSIGVASYRPAWSPPSASGPLPGPPAECQEAAP